MAEETPNESPAFTRYAPAKLDGEPITPEKIEERLLHLQDAAHLNSQVLASSTFAGNLTTKQRKYAMKLMEVGADRWREAADYAGYAPGTARLNIESTTALVDFMAAIRYEIAIAESITLTSVRSNLTRLGRRAEQAGDYSAAIRAEKLVGDTIGAFVPGNSDTTPEGTHTTIMIMPGRNKNDDDATDAIARELIEMNADDDVLALPE